MPRVSSQRTRQAILVTDAIDPLVDPEKLVLLDQFGDPISLSSAAGLPVGGVSGQMLVKTSDDDYDTTWIDQPDPVTGLPAGGATGKLLAKASGADGDVAWVSPPPASDVGAMHFRGIWNTAMSFVQGDVVLDGTGLYILTAASLIANQTKPSLETGLSDTATATAGPMSGGTVYRIYPDTGKPSIARTDSKDYFIDLLTGGTLTMSMPDTTGDYLQSWISTGASAGANYPSPGFGTSLVITVSGPARYFFRAADAFAGAGYVNNPLIVLSAGATWDPGTNKWRKIADTVA